MRHSVLSSFVAFLLAGCLAGLGEAPAAAQNPQRENRAPLPKQIKVGREHVKTRRDIKLPDIAGYKPLKCDFHIHTMFSDGVVWPSLRVEEAWEEGLDAISITDHIEGQPARPGVMPGHNRGYEAAQKAADRRDIILIRGGEITRSMPPGHLNALFVKDVDALDRPDVMEAIGEAHRQGAFIQWNHPGWGVDSIMWHPVHEELLRRGWLNGIEVFNEFEWYPVALDWANDRGITILGNTDVHDVTDRLYGLSAADGPSHRPMTLVLAKERTAEAIKEALFDGRTLVYFYDTLMGKEPYLASFFDGAVEVTDGHMVDGEGQYVQLTNCSDVPLHLRRVDPAATAYPATVDIPADGTVMTRHDGDAAGGAAGAEYEVTNLVVSPRQNLRVRLFGGK